MQARYYYSNNHQLQLRIIQSLKGKVSLDSILLVPFLRNTSFIFWLALVLLLTYLYYSRKINLVEISTSPKLLEYKNLQNILYEFSRNNLDLKMKKECFKTNVPWQVFLSILY